MVALSNVQFGRTNNDIRTVQRALVARGHRVDEITGHFGPQTKAAYAAEQRAQGFTGRDADGNPGCASLTALGRSQGFPVTCVTPRAPAVTGRVPSPVPGRGVSFPFYSIRPWYRWRPDGKPRHTGDDYAADANTPVVAVRKGKIAWANKNGGAYGKWIGLKADNGRIYLYCHLNQLQVRAGQSVRAGQQIGLVGSTGQSSGPHLHFEMSKTGSWFYGNVAKPTW
ncbi:M23 family metallopeptidase [Streptomyces litchfieldiae]|uniref:Peptidoglycan DD-metalloendopeptidase family protein n=1 Tax=Streptomyces litchfieldiae TaxID=3075543 RepID=A0ABU2MSD8_9ACTN|nr:peptidoglycan DD-metalloendopeptidase family protein [Streptomyces sp. DSM 44938]MDT0344531.1 peptidoglycan DD-metalloendopeptidase family protein [Streptomyces sp. DSM 44938]